MNYSEEFLRELALRAMNELGTAATPEAVAKRVEELIAGSNSAVPSAVMPGGDRIILTAFGLNKPGVVARITGALTTFGCDIQDISQKIMQDFFTMIMLVSLNDETKNLKDLQEAMNTLSNEMNIKVYLQHEDVFRYMHRI